MCDTVAPKFRIAARASLRQKGRGSPHSALQLQRGGDPVTGLELVGAVGLAVRVQVDEPRRHDEAGDVQLHLAGQRLLRDCGDLRSAYADVAHCVQSRLGVHHAAARQHDVVALLGMCGGVRGQDDREGGERDDGAGTDRVRRGEAPEPVAGPRMHA